MSKKIDFNIPITPVAASRPRVTRWAVYYGRKYEKFRLDFRDWIEKNVKSSDKLMGAIILSKCKFKMKIPKSYSKKKRNLLNGTPHIIRPDIDNLEKALKDGLSGSLYDDDSQIWKNENVYKVWSLEPGIEIEFRET